MTERPQKVIGGGRYGQFPLDFSQHCGGRRRFLFLHARRITTTARLLKWRTDYRAIEAHSCLDAEESRGRLDQWNIAPPRWGRLSGMGAMVELPIKGLHVRPAA